MTRVERDWQGPVEVPTGAYFGPQTARVLQYHPITGRPLDDELVRALGFIKWAAAIVNHREGRIPAKEFQAIKQAAEDVASGALSPHFVLDDIQVGSGTSSNMNANEVIANRANEILGAPLGARAPVHPINHVNLGQSSNDVFPTAVHTAALRLCQQQLIPSLEQLRESLAAKAQAFSAVVKPGRTHLMDAAPIFLGQEFQGYARQVELGVGRFRSAMDRLVEVPLGGTAVGTGLNITPETTRQVIHELAVLVEVPALREAADHFEAQGSRDALVEFSATCKVVAVSMTKIVNDLRWMASGPRNGLGEISLPPIPPSSSIMPAKGTPAIPEVVAQLCAQVIANDFAVTLGGMSGAFELNAYVPLMASNILDSIRHLTRSAALLASECVDGIEARTAELRRAAENSLAVAAALVPLIGYDRSAEIVRRAVADETSVAEAIRVSGLAPDIDAESLLDVDTLARGGDREVAEKIKREDQDG